MSEVGFLVAVAVGGLAAWAFRDKLTGQTPNTEKVIYASAPVAQPQEGNKLADLLGLVTGVIATISPDQAATVSNQTNSLADRLSGALSSVTGALGGVAGGSIGSRLMADLMRDFGFARHQAAGVVGNLDHESAGFATLQEISPTVAGSRGGYGYAQWTGSRRRDFEAWAAARGLALSSYEANYGFLRYELTSTAESRVVPKLRAARTVEEATRIFSETYLRPGIVHMSSRLARAQAYA